MALVTTPLLGALLASLLAAAGAGAQPVIRDDEELAFDRPEAWAMKYFTSTTLLGGFGPPRAREPGSVELGLELGWIPELDREERRVGFRGSKVEDLNKAPVLARPRAVIGLPGGFGLTLAYVPPVEVFDLEAELYGAALGRPLLQRGDWRLGARLFAQTGTVTSDITCPGELATIDDPEIDPLGCEEPSRDEITMRYSGLELSAAHDDGGPWVPHLTAAGNWLDMEFQVDALTNGLRDRTRLTADGFTWSAAAGVRYRHRSRATLALEAFYTPLEVVRPGAEHRSNDPLLHLRALLSWRLR